MAVSVLLYGNINKILCKRSVACANENRKLTLCSLVYVIICVTFSMQLNRMTKYISDQYPNTDNTCKFVVTGLSENWSITRLKLVFLADVIILNVIFKFTIGGFPYVWLIVVLKALTLIMKMQRNFWHNIDVLEIYATVNSNKKKN